MVGLGKALMAGGQTYSGARQQQLVDDAKRQQMEAQALEMALMKQRDVREGEKFKLDQQKFEQDTKDADLQRDFNLYKFGSAMAGDSDPMSSVPEEQIKPFLNSPAMQFFTRNEGPEQEGQRPTYAVQQPASSKAALQQNQIANELKRAEIRAASDDRRSQNALLAALVRQQNRPDPNQNRPVQVSSVNRIADIDAAVGQLAGLRGTTSKPGSTGFTAWLGDWTPDVVTEATGWGANAKRTYAQIALAKQIIGKGLEGGVLRKEDEEKYAHILPTIWDSEPVKLGKMAGLQRALEAKRQSEIDALESAGFNVGNFKVAPRLAPSADWVVKDWKVQ